MNSRFGFTVAVVVFLFFMAGSTRAQNPIPNASFEDWSGGDPVGWLVSNFPGFTNVTQSSDAQHGVSSMKMEVVDLAGTPLIPFAYTGDISQLGFPVSQRYSSLEGYFKFFPNGSEVFVVNVEMAKNGLQIGAGIFVQTTQVSSWTHFSAAIQYFSAEIPDTCFIAILIADTNEVNNMNGTYGLVDNLNFGSPTGIEPTRQEEIPTRTSLAQNFPNPFNPATTIAFELKESGPVTLRVYNTVGQVVTVLVNEHLGAGSYRVQWEPGDLPGGVYFYRLETSSSQLVKKMLFIR